MEEKLSRIERTFPAKEIPPQVDTTCTPVSHSEMVGKTEPERMKVKNRWEQGKVNKIQ